MAFPSLDPSWHGVVCRRRFRACYGLPDQMPRTWRAAAIAGYTDRLSTEFFMGAILDRSIGAAARGPSPADGARALLRRPQARRSIPCRDRALAARPRRHQEHRHAGGAADARRACRADRQGLRGRRPRHDAVDGALQEARRQRRCTCRIGRRSPSTASCMSAIRSRSWSPTRSIWPATPPSASRSTMRRAPPWCRRARRSSPARRSSTTIARTTRPISTRPATRPRPTPPSPRPRT